MKFLTENRFSFVSAGLAPATFGVVHFSGREAISALFEFNITLVTDDPNLDLDRILLGPATFSIHRPNDQQVDFTGILSQFEQLHAFNECIFYRAQLRPRLWWLTLTHHNQVCLNLPVVSSPSSSPQASLIGRILIDGGLTALDFAFRNQKTYAPQDYVCQYDESHYAFFCRWLEREGLYYFFEQTDGVDKVVITDSMISQMDFPQEGNLIYAPPSGLEGHHQDEVITNLICRQKMLPQKVLLRDHNYERPSLELTGTAMVDPQGRGESYLYGEYFRTPEEGNRLAKIYAESLFCRKREFIGESTVPFMMPGYTFSLTNHYRDDFNRKYLVCEVHHEGNQTGYLISGLQRALSDVEQAVSYRNTFVAIPAEVQYRAERVTAKPRISGTLHAVVDAEGSGEYAELDDQGRYKVRLPFDINEEHRAGKASCFLRMAQPYAGPKRGMHFPLPKGTEVLLTFIGGDPDRPVIASAVPNPETPSPSTAKNQTESVIQTGGDNKIRIEDKKGKERIIMQSPTANSWFRIGAPNDPLTTINETAGDGIRIHSEHDLWMEAQQQYGEYRCGKNADAPKKDSSSNIPLTGDLLDHFTNTDEYNPTNLFNRHTGDSEDWSTVLNNAHIKVSSLDTVKTQEGNIYDFGGYWNYNLGNSYAEFHINQKSNLNVQNKYLWPQDQETTTDDFSPWSGALVGGGIIGGTLLFVGSTMGACALALGESISGATFATFSSISLAVTAASSGLGAFFTSGESFQGNIGDVINKPGDGKITTWFGKVGSSFKNIDSSTGKPTSDCIYEQDRDTSAKEGPMHTDTTWVEKKIGDSYSYTRGNEISIKVGNSENHTRGDIYEFQYGGTRESTRFSDSGKKMAWEKAGKGDSQEAHWDPVSGLINTYEYKNHGWFSFSANFALVPRIKFSTSLSSLVADVSLSAGGRISVNASASLAMDVNVSTGIYVKMDAKRGLEASLNEVTGWSGFKTIGLEAQKDAAVKAKVQELMLAQAESKIGAENLALIKRELKLHSSSLSFEQGFNIFAG